MGLLLEDMKNDIISLNNIKSQSCGFFEEYKIIPFVRNYGFKNKKRETDFYYIIGINKINNKNNLYNNSRLLLSFIEIGKMINDNTDFYKWGDYALENKLDEIINPVKEVIIKWCKKYGMPYFDDNFYKNFFDKNKRNHLIGFNIINFMERAYKLYELFIAWEAIRNNDLNNLNNLKSKIFNKYKLEELIETFIIEINYDDSTLFNPIMYDISFDKKNKEFNLLPKSWDLFTIAIYQFKMIIFRNNLEGGLRTCKHCGRPFELSHGKALYCDDCKPFKAALNQKTYRERKKAKQVVDK